jgi:hypothetical protein
MTDRRLSIIPARAVADPRLEGRDLQVLCFLGMHTDKLGWCFLTQGMIADKLRCGRSTVQRSIARLIEAEYVQTREFSGSRPHACHAYRVVLDLDDPLLDPPEYAVGGSEPDERCPPVGTSEVPEVPEVPAYERAHNEVEVGGGKSARAREPLLKPDAFALAERIAAIAGFPDPKAWPAGWCVAPMRVQGMLDRGWQPELMIATAQSVMARKSDGPPETVGYFEKPFARAHAQNQKPLPTVEGSSNHHAQSRKGGFADALARLKSTFTSDAAGGGSEADGIQQGGLGAARLIADRRS